MVDNDTETLSRDLAFDILSNRRRRYALHYLIDHPEGVPLQTLAREIAAWENETPVESLSRKQRKRVYVSLYQTHIPKLEEVDIVEYDDDTGTITLTGRARQMQPYLDTDRGRTIEWIRYYLGLLAVGTLLFAVTVLDIGPFATVSAAVVGAVIVAAFSVLAAVHVVVSRREPSGRTGRRTRLV